MKRFGAFILESSHGKIELDANGIPTNLEKDDDEPCYLDQIAKFDVEEFYEYLKNGWGDVPFDVEDGTLYYGDVLDMGYWTKDGEYNSASKKWREEIFTQQLN
jgi:hypothetical protein